MIDVNKIREDFPMLKNKSRNGHDIVYFDNAATTFKPQCVIDAVTEYYTTYSVNAHRGDYELSYIVDTKYENVRKRVAQFINCDPKEVVFTSGASQSLNTIARGYGSTHLKFGDVILSDESEHASNYLPWVKTCEKTGAVMEFIKLDENGAITVDNFKQAMHAGVKVVAIAQVGNVLANEVDVKEICKIAHEYGAIVVVDGAQSTPHMKVDVKDLDCDFFAFSAHKLCGPTGLGIMYGKYELLEASDPDTYGGGSNARYDMCGNILLKNAPYKFESGTPAIEAALGTKVAIDYIDAIGMDAIHDYECELRNYALKQMQQLDQIIIYNANSTGSVITFNVKDIFAQDVATYLSNAGISLRSGQHCAKLLNDYLKAPATLRASFYFYNTKEEIDYFIDVLKKVTPESCLDVFF